MRDTKKIEKRKKKVNYLLLLNKTTKKTVLLSPLYMKRFISFCTHSVHIKVVFNKITVKQNY